MGIERDVWFRWAVGIVLLFVFAVSGYSLTTVVELQQNDARNTQLLQTISVDVKDIKDRFTEQDKDIKSFYQKRPVFDADLKAAILTHRH